MANKHQSMIPVGLEGNELTEWLNNHCDNTREGEYTRELTEEELIQKNAEYVRIGMLHDVTNDQFTDVKKGFQKRLKEYKGQTKDLSKIIRKQAIEESGEIYVFRDDLAGRITEYTPQGKLIISRRMTPEDRQNIIKFPIEDKKAQ